MRRTLATSYSGFGVLPLTLDCSPAIRVESLPLCLRFLVFKRFLRMLNNPALPTSQYFVK